MSPYPEISITYGRTSAVRLSVTYRDNIVLLACEVAGKGREIIDNEHPNTHVIEKLDSLLVRYIFLIPSAMVFSRQLNRPAVEDDSMAAFKKIASGKI